MRNGQPDEKLDGIQKMISEGAKLIEDAKRTSCARQDKLWQILGLQAKLIGILINTILNKAKIPMIPPLLENGLFITDFTEKAQIFNGYFILQCTTIDTGSEIPQFTPAPFTVINDFTISKVKILNVIRSLNPNKAHGWVPWVPEPKSNKKKK